jgi:hypothetical protein
MYILKDNGVISEITCGNNFEYILKDSTSFANTDYKVLSSQNNGIFVKCMKINRNGHVSLYYLTEDYRPMSSMFVGITADALVNVVISLFGSILEVRNNGFLACQCIDLSWDKIFVEQRTLKVKLIYLPLSVKAFDSYTEFENELKVALVKLIDKVIVNNNPKIDQLVRNLRDGTLSIENIYNKFRGVGSAPVPEQTTPSNVSFTANQAKGASNYMNTSKVNKDGIKLIAMNTALYFEIVIDKNRVTIGKKKEAVDVVISFNRMISRQHCEISLVNGLYYIGDLGSMNGTYVNNVRVKVGTKVRINRGDIVRLADTDFRVV